MKVNVIAYSNQLPNILCFVHLLKARDVELEGRLNDPTFNNKYLDKETKEEFSNHEIMNWIKQEEDTTNENITVQDNMHVQLPDINEEVASFRANSSVACLPAKSLVASLPAKSPVPSLPATSSATSLPAKTSVSSVACRVKIEGKETGPDKQVINTDMPSSSSSESDCDELDSPLGSKSRKKRKKLRELETMKDLMRQLKEQKEETNRILMALGN